MKAWELEAVVGEHRDFYNGNCMQVFIMRIRKKAGNDFVATQRAAGYGLSDTARLQIAKAVSEDTQAKTLNIEVTMPREPMKFWTAERVGLLAQMRREGLFYSEAAKRLHCTRSAAVGAGHRYLKDAAA